MNSKPASPTSGDRALEHISDLIEMLQQIGDEIQILRYLDRVEAQQQQEERANG